MKKEALLAIFLGLLIGLAVAGIFYHQRQQSTAIPLSPVSSDNNLTVNELDNPNPSAHTPVKLDLAYPKPNSVITTATITLEGSTDPGNAILIVSDKHELILYPDEAGKFTTELNLVKGANDISIMAVSTTNQTHSINLTIIYTTDKNLWNEV